MHAHLIALLFPERKLAIRDAAVPMLTAIEVPEVEVAVGGPADAAGILPGDVLIRIDGKVVKNARSAMSRIAQSGPGTKLQLEGIRDGKTFRTTAVTGHRPES